MELSTLGNPPVNPAENNQLMATSSIQHEINSGGQILVEHGVLNHEYEEDFQEDNNSVGDVCSDELNVSHNDKYNKIVWIKTWNKK